MFQIDYIRHESTGIIVLCDPPYNKLQDPAFTDKEKLRSFLQADDLKAVIVTGAGRNFCAGADPVSIEKLKNDPDALKERIDEGKALLENINSAPVPVIAMVNGSCLGGGLEIALACHFRFASEGAMFGFPETSLGLIPGLGGTIPKAQIKASVLMDMILSAQMIGAHEARERGIVDFVVSKQKLEEAVRSFISKLTAKNSPELIHAVMESINNSRTMSRPEALRRETELFCKFAQRTNFAVDGDQ